MGTLAAEVEVFAFPGRFFKSLRFDPETNLSKTILLKFSAGARYPYHGHPAGEEIFVL